MWVARALRGIQGPQARNRHRSLHCARQKPRGRPASRWARSSHRAAFAAPLCSTGQTEKGCSAPSNGLCRARALNCRSKIGRIGFCWLVSMWRTYDSEAPYSSASAARVGCRAASVRWTSAPKHSAPRADAAAQRGSLCSRTECPPTIPHHGRWPPAVMSAAPCLRRGTRTAHDNPRFSATPCVAPLPVN